MKVLLIIALMMTSSWANLVPNLQQEKLFPNVTVSVPLRLGLSIDTFSPNDYDNSSFYGPTFSAAVSHNFNPHWLVVGGISFGQYFDVSDRYAAYELRFTRIELNGGIERNWDFQQYWFKTGVELSMGYSRLGTEAYLDGGPAEINYSGLSTGLGIYFGPEFSNGLFPSIRVGYRYFKSDSENLEKGTFKQSKKLSNDIDLSGISYQLGLSYLF